MRALSLPTLLQFQLVLFFVAWSPPAAASTLVANSRGSLRAAGRVLEPQVEPKVLEFHHHAHAPLEEAHAAVPEHVRPTNKFVYVLFMILVGYVFWLCLVLINLYRTFSSMLAAMEDKPNWTFSAYLHYRFAYWFVWDDNAKLVVLLSVCFTLVVAGTAAYVLALDTTLGHSAYVIFTILVEPDAGKGEMTWEGKAIACVVSISGLLIFAVLLAVIQTRFNQTLEQLRDGTAAIIECGHYVVVGWTEQALNLIDELCDAYEEKGGCHIVVLSEVAKPLVEDQVRRRVPLRGSRVIVRTGNVCNRDSLKRVAAHTARTVVILSDTAVPEEMRDSSAIRVLLTLRAEDWPTDGRILVQRTRAKNKELFDGIGGRITNVVAVEDFVGRMIVQCSRQCGISSVIKQTLGFKGSEFYIQRAPECIVGLRFQQALYHFPLAILAGVLPHAAGAASSGPKNNLARQSSLSAFTKRLSSKRDVQALPRQESTQSLALNETGTFLWFPEDHIISKEDDIVLFADHSEALGALPEPMAQSASELRVRADFEDRMLGFEHNHSSHGINIWQVEVGSWAERQGLQVGDEITAINGNPVRGLDENEVFDALQRRPLQLSVERTLPTQRRSVREGSSERQPKQSPRRSVGSIPLGERAETILLIGWNESAWHIISDLDQSCLRGTSVVSYSGVPKDQRESSLQKYQVYHNMPLINVRVTYEDGMVGSRFHMDRALKTPVLLGTTRIFVLTDQVKQTPPAARDPDSGVITTVLHVRHMLKDAFKAAGQGDGGEACIPIVVEVAERETEEHCRRMEVLDFVDSAAVASQVISMIAYEPRLAGMLEDLVSETATMTMAIRHLSDYPGPLDEKRSMSFLDLVEVAQRFGELPLGWSKLPGDKDNEDDNERMEGQNVLLQATVERLARASRTMGPTNIEWEMNPADKTARRPWDPKADQLVVLCPRNATNPAKQRL